MALAGGRFPQPTGKNLGLNYPWRKEHLTTAPVVSAAPSTSDAAPGWLYDWRGRWQVHMVGHGKTNEDMQATATRLAPAASLSGFVGRPNMMEIATRRDFLRDSVLASRRRLDRDVHILQHFR